MFPRNDLEYGECGSLACQFSKFPIGYSSYLCISILLCSGMTPLHFALASGNEDMVQLLKKAGAAQETGEVVDFMKKKVAASFWQIGGWTKLHLLCLRGELGLQRPTQEETAQEVEAALVGLDQEERSAALEAKNDKSLTPLLVSAHCNNLAALAALLRAGAGAGAEDGAGDGLAHLATDEDLIVAAREEVGWARLREVRESGGESGIDL